MFTKFGITNCTLHNRNLKGVRGPTLNFECCLRKLTNFRQIWPRVILIDLGFNFLTKNFSHSELSVVLTSFLSWFPNYFHKYFQSQKQVYIHKYLSVCLSVTNVHQFICQSKKPLNSLKSSSFIIHPSTFIILHSSFLHFATFKLFSLFKLGVI